jgi:hypothetical protein
MQSLNRNQPGWLLLLPGITILRGAKINYAHLVLADADYITYEVCVEDTPSGYWQPPTQPSNIKKCNA